MASKDKKLIKLYKSDLGTEFDQKLVPFSITSKMDDCIQYDDRVGACGCPVPFEMRHLVATFDPEEQKDRKCLIVKFPVPDVADIPDYVDKIRQCGAVCIDLIGEAWSIIPPAYKQQNYYEPSYDLITLAEAGKFSPKLSGRMKEYASDISGQVLLPKLAIEVDPIELATLIFGTAPTKNEDSGLYEPTEQEAGCTGKLVKQDVCSLSDVTARYITLRGNSTYADISEKQKKLPKRFLRKVPLKTKGDIFTCVRDISQGFEGIQCFGYQGESIARIDLLV